MPGKNFNVATPLAEGDGMQGLAPLALDRPKRRKRRRVVKKKGGNAQTLRDYWTHHGHGGPTHYAGADAIAWGTPGDFDRCVALMSKHMTPEQAKGYCNLRHHDALGYYPATHARMERGKMGGLQVATGWLDEITKGAVPGEPRVQSGPQGGQFTAGGGDDTGASGKQKTGRRSGGGKDSGRAAQRARIKARIADLTKQIHALEHSLAELKKASAAANSKTGATSTPSSQSTSSAGSQAQTSSSSSSTSSSASSSSESGLKQKIANLRAERKTLEGQLTSNKSVRNVREPESGRFRTFQGEAQEAHRALTEGRHGDAMDLLGSARALARTDDDRVQLDQLHNSVARVQHGGPVDGQVVADLAKMASVTVAKVGPHGWSHGWIRAGGEAPSRKAAHATKNDQTGRTVMFNGRPTRVGDKLVHGEGKAESIYRIHDAVSGENIGTGDGTSLAQSPTIRPTQEGEESDYQRMRPGGPTGLEPHPEGTILVQKPTGQ